IDTPNIDRLAADGLRYTNFHVTPVCSPTRAALLTGRNHHAVGMRAVSNFDTGFPNMRGRIDPAAATIAEVLQPAGWATFCVGKWHLAPMREASAAGPFSDCRASVLPLLAVWCDPRSPSGAGRLSREVSRSL
ncbi:MAG: hypothetical protein EBY65_09005, partial [Acidimicrobiia bacterium]|nr:hypothetical protein [Acidimicrobiia bacterium]